MSMEDIQNNTGSIINEFREAINELTDAATEYISAMDSYNEITLQDATIIKEKLKDKLLRAGLLEEESGS